MFYVKVEVEVSVEFRRIWNIFPQMFVKMLRETNIRI